MGKMHIKWTKVDAFINYVAVCLFIFQLVLVFIFGYIGNRWKDAVGEKHYYLQNFLSDGWYIFLIIPLRFLLLNSTIIPISLKVTLDVCKLYYSRFIGWDMRMFASKKHGEPDRQPAKANNTGISEDLGQIEYILSDKTGTLTQNNMVSLPHTHTHILVTVPALPSLLLMSILCSGIPVLLCGRQGLHR